ncbi:MAG: chromophore lyase CpcT/CpeT [Gammaproteobacteria bacterium]|nr:chromophore lyase CpcT/CpeT [Gammaproteobacteria bacterium]MBT8444760.1 chromophore lyase CpcT/CpeT [Gammaproteobacteria bacterium]
MKSIRLTDKHSLLPLLFIAAPTFFCAAVAGDRNDGVRAMLAMMVGTYRSDPSAEPDAELPDLLDRRMRIEAPALGRHLIYWQLNSGPERKVYRQRILTFTAGDDGEIVQATWSLREPEKFVDAFESPARFAQLTADDVEASLPDGCDQIWRRSQDGWYGSVSPDTCRVWSERRQMWRRIGAEARIAPGAYFQAERGFDDDGNQVFGTKPGELYRLDRVQAE